MLLKKIKKTVLSLAILSSPLAAHAGVLTCKSTSQKETQLSFNIKNSGGTIELDDAQPFFQVQQKETKRTFSILDSPMEGLSTITSLCVECKPLYFQIFVGQENPDLAEHDHDDDSESEIMIQDVVKLEVKLNLLNLALKQPGLWVPAGRIRWWPVVKVEGLKTENSPKSECMYTP